MRTLSHFRVLRTSLEFCSVRVRYWIRSFGAYLDTLLGLRWAHYGPHLDPLPEGVGIM